MAFSNIIAFFIILTHSSRPQCGGVTNSTRRRGGRGPAPLAGDDLRLFALDCRTETARGPGARRLGCVLRSRGVRLAGTWRAKAPDAVGFYSNCRRHGRGNSRSVIRQSTHPNADLSAVLNGIVAVPTCGHDGGRYAPFGIRVVSSAGRHSFLWDGLAQR